MKRFRLSMRTLISLALGESIGAVSFVDWPRTRIDLRAAAIIFCACWYLGWSLPVVSFAFDWKDDPEARQEAIFAGLFVVMISSGVRVPLFMVFHEPACPPDFLGSRAIFWATGHL
jgi:hypothetical protein